MIEELLEASCVVFLIDSLSESMFLAVVAKHVDFFVQSSQRQIELNSLLPRHRIVFVVSNHQQWSLHTIRAEQRRVVKKTQRVIPETAANARLGAFVLKLARETCSPTNAAVRARHVRN